MGLLSSLGSLVGMAVGGRMSTTNANQISTITLMEIAQ